MDVKQIKLVKNLLGDDIFEVLEKAEIHKFTSNTAVDPEEIKIALQIVPRSILSFLFAHLKPLHDGENKEIYLPFANGTLYVNKLSADNYSGHIIDEGKRLNEFKYRSLPGIGLILMSSFELYNIEQLKEIKQENPQEPPCCKHDKIDRLQDIIDERLRLHSLVSCVVNKKLSEREAIREMINDKLNQSIVIANTSIVEIEHEEEFIEDEGMEEPDKKSKLREFLENKENRRSEAVEFDKAEIHCPDCKSQIYKGEKKIKLCICFGGNMNKEIKIQKSENGKCSFKLPKNFDIDDIEMLRDALKGIGVG